MQKQKWGYKEFRYLVCIVKRALACPSLLHFVFWGFACQIGWAFQFSFLVHLFVGALLMPFSITNTVTISKRKKNSDLEHEHLHLNQHLQNHLTQMTQVVKHLLSVLKKGEKKNWQASVLSFIDWLLLRCMGTENPLTIPSSIKYSSHWHELGFNFKMDIGCQAGAQLFNETNKVNVKLFIVCVFFNYLFGWKYETCFRLDILGVGRSWQEIGMASG